jgi:thioredoxin 1
MIYKQGQMIWRQAGELDANTIISLVQEQFLVTIFSNFTRSTPR